MIKKKRILMLTDGDMVAFSHAAAEEYGKEEDEIQVHKILQSIDRKMEGLVRRLQPTDTITFLSGSVNMRHVVEPQYKANRDGVWRPANLKNAKGHLKAAWGGLEMPGLEADDLLGAFARCDYEIIKGKHGVIKQLVYLGPCTYDEVIIVSLDKDLRQLQTQIDPVTGNRIGPKITHYQWERESLGIGEKFVEPVGLGELKVIIKTSSSGKQKKEVKGNGPLFFLWQLLVGDSTDGVIGCGIMETKIYKTGKKAGQEYEKRSGVGALEAYEILKNVTKYSEGLNLVANQYVLHFADGWQRELLKNGRLLYMHTRIDEGNLVRLWHFNGRIVDRYSLKERRIIPHEEYVPKDTVV